MLTFLSHVTFSNSQINRLETKKAVQIYWQTALSNQTEGLFIYFYVFLLFLEPQEKAALLLQ